MSDHEAFDIVGGSHVSVTKIDPDPRFKLMIGRDPDEIENHEFIENNPD